MCPYPDHPPAGLAQKSIVATITNCIPKTWFASNCYCLVAFGDATGSRAKSNHPQRRQLVRGGNKNRGSQEGVGDDASLQCRAREKGLAISVPSRHCL